jgi:hypothetical protein
MTVMKKIQIQFLQVLSTLFLVIPAFGQTLKRDFSFSVYSYLSTNYIFSSKTTNKFSINLLHGHSNGTEVAEIGGLVNMDKGRVKYLQLAGLANINNDSLEGFQSAGLFNLVKKHVNGFQSAGLFNHTSSASGAQLAGIYNYNRVQFKGFQAGGLFNITDSLEGCQVAGLYNQAGKLDGIQISGLVNKAKNVNGIQISGLVNKAKNVNGCQIGVVNLSDSCKGIPIGLFNYVKSGYHSMEISANEMGFVNLGWKTGVNKFHNVFFAGVNGFAPKFLWTLGLGIGNTFSIAKKWQLTSEATTQHIFSEAVYNTRMVFLHKISMSAEYKYSNHFSIAFGPSFNVLNYDNRSIQYASSINAIVPYSIYSVANIEDRVFTKTWVGAHLSFKFF